MIGRWFNEWVENRLAVAITLAADMRAAVEGPFAQTLAREITADEAKSIAAAFAMHGLRPRQGATVIPFPTANDHDCTPSAPPDPAA